MVEQPTINGAWIAAFLRAAGRTEFQIPDEWLEGPGSGSTVIYRDERADVTVFKLVTPGGAVNGEETAAPEMASGA